MSFLYTNYNLIIGNNEKELEEMSTYHGNRVERHTWIPKGTNNMIL